MQIIDLQNQFVPNHVRKSPLFKQGGFAVYAGLLSAQWHQAMLIEAQTLMPYAKENKSTQPDPEEVRGGTPPRAFLSTTGGSVQHTFYHSPNLKAFLKQVTGLPVRVSGMQGTYSYYARRGDYLSLHRDIETCDLAVITCLKDSGQIQDSGGRLCLYPSRCYELLSQVRATPAQGLVQVHLKPNHTIVMYGGIIPHWVTPASHSQMRITSVLCYRV